MRILVIGANGKVGRHLVRVLRERDHEVRSLLRHPSPRAFQDELLGGEEPIADSIRAWS